MKKRFQTFKLPIPLGHARPHRELTETDLEKIQDFLNLPPSVGIRRPYEGEDKVYQRENRVATRVELIPIWLCLSL